MRDGPRFGPYSCPYAVYASARARARGSWMFIRAVERAFGVQEDPGGPRRRLQCRDDSLREQGLPICA